MVGRPMYDMTPPAPTAYPKLLHYSLELSRYYQHKLQPSFITASKPLLIGCDVGIPIEELILFTKDYSNLEVTKAKLRENCTRKMRPYSKNPSWMHRCLDLFTDHPRWRASTAWPVSGLPACGDSCI